MNDPGEKISQTLKREFMEEAIDCLGENKERKEEIAKYLKEFFDVGEEVIFKYINLSENIQILIAKIKIYKGYVDDPRNTDNAWMETAAFNFHDEDGTVFRDFELKAGQLGIEKITLN